MNRTLFCICLSVLELYYTTHTICLSPVTWTGHITLPCPSTAQHSTAHHRTAAAQEIPLHLPSLSPGNNQQQSKQASTTYTTWATSRHCRPNQRITYTLTLTNTRIATYCLPKAGEIVPDQIFRNVKANGRGESRAASVCLVSSLPSSVRICTLYQPTPDSAGDPTIGQQWEAQGRQSADHSTSTHPSTIARSGSGTELTDHRRSSALRSVSGAEFLGATAREQ